MAIYFKRDWVNYPDKKFDNLWVPEHRIAILPRGEWEEDKPYNRLDLVTYHGKLYLAKQGNVAISPVYEEYWVELEKDTKEDGWEPIAPIQIEPKEYKCKSCGAPLKQGQTKCEWCRTVYSW